VDCGGDLRVAAGYGAPWEVRVRHPLTGTTAHTFRVRVGGVATSGIDTRLWEREDGDFAHHLLDPATGAPAWTGLVAATALAPTAVEAEALAKAALLSGPAAGRRLLRARYGGVLVHDDGSVDPVV
jgi:thiamine biosynthesis lipoprotein